jgi:uncharacterized protein
MGEGEPYRLIKNGDLLEGGVMRHPEMMPVSAWTVYFEVADINASYAKVKELGGSSATEIIEVPGTGRFAAMADPQGAMFAIIQEGPM